MPNSITIRRCVRKEPITREDYMLKKLRKLGVIPEKEKRMYQLPKAPGVFSLGPDYEPVQVPNNEVVQPISEIDITSLKSIKNGMNNLF